MKLSDYRKLTQKKNTPSKPKVERKHKVVLSLDPDRSELVAASLLRLVTIGREVQYVEYDEGGGRILFLHEGTKYEVTVKPILS